MRQRLQPLQAHQACRSETFCPGTLTRWLRGTVRAADLSLTASLACDDYVEQH